MKIRELGISGAYEVTPVQHRDDRGVFLELFKEQAFVEAVGHRLELRQANVSVSSRGTLRGVHYADVPPGQAKYVTCLAGAAVDVAVDIRVGSPTYGRWDSVLLDTVDRRAIYLGEGIGHAFLALEDATTVGYLCSEGYSPGREHGIHPLDPALAIEWPSDVAPLLSPKDDAATGLAEAAAAGLLPDYDACLSYYASLRAG